LGSTAYSTFQAGIDGASHGFAVWQRASNGTLTVPQNFTTKGGPVGWLPTVEYYPSPYGAKADCFAAQPGESRVCIVQDHHVIAWPKTAT
jgi:hypothetical protein